ncbi:hypothetical protein C8R44DRAFT_726686 [Mycena epipterygia]|nr:hypothetical protein C8R44DRAFT_726686 [Mycena epipterygia]
MWRGSSPRTHAINHRTRLTSHLRLIRCQCSQNGCSWSGVPSGRAHEDAQTLDKIRLRPTSPASLPVRTTRWSGNRWRGSAGGLEERWGKKGREDREGSGKTRVRGDELPRSACPSTLRQVARYLSSFPAACQLFPFKWPTPAPSPCGIKTTLSYSSFDSILLPILPWTPCCDSAESAINTCVRRYRVEGWLVRRSNGRVTIVSGEGAQLSAGLYDHQFALSLARCVSSRVAGPCASSPVFDRVPLNQDARERGSGEARTSVEEDGPSTSGGVLRLNESDRAAWYDPPTRSISSSRTCSTTRARSIWGPSHLRGRDSPRIQDPSSRRVIAGLLEPPCCASSLESTFCSGVDSQNDVPDVAGVGTGGAHPRAASSFLRKRGRG